MQQQTVVLQQQCFHTNTVKDPGSAREIRKIIWKHPDLNISVVIMLGYCKGFCIGCIAVKGSKLALGAVIVFQSMPHARIRK